MKKSKFVWILNSRANKIAQESTRGRPEAIYYNQQIDEWKSSSRVSIAKKQ